MNALNALPGRATSQSFGSAVPPASGGYKVDISRGARIGRVSSEWFSRPDDERYVRVSRSPRLTVRFSGLPCCDGILAVPRQEFAKPGGQMPARQLVDGVGEVGFGVEAV